jgi:hypothetical protein
MHWLVLFDGLLGGVAAFGLVGVEEPGGHLAFEQRVALAAGEVGRGPAGGQARGEQQDHAHIRAATRSAPGGSGKT